MRFNISSIFKIGKRRKNKTDDKKEKIYKRAGI